MCQYQSLYFGNEGYIARCKECGFYQLAYISTMVLLTKQEYHTFYELVSSKYNEEDYSFTENKKYIILSLPVQGACMLLTRNEITRLYQILEEADTEIKSLEFIELFK